MRILGRVQICLLEGGTLWIGRFGTATTEHAHHAVQITLALEGSFQFRARGNIDGLSLCGGAIIPPHLAHTFIGHDALVAHIFVEPESRIGRALVEKIDEKTIYQIPAPIRDECIAVLRDFYDESHECTRLVVASQEVVGMLTSGAEPAKATDPRVLQAIDLLRDRLDGSVRETDIAAAVYLSPSRFRHLFVEETGMPFRTYVLWLRIGRAVMELTKGTSLTAAAHAAGFSDQAHLSRTFRRMFGLAPSSLRFEE